MSSSLHCAGKRCDDIITTARGTVSSGFVRPQRRIKVIVLIYTTMSSVLDSLVALGLSRLEAEVYAFLLANRPVTAYAIGKRLSKPTANVYKAVDSLARRGAVLVEEGENRRCRAVPAEEFMEHARLAFRRKTETAAQTLAKLGQQPDDERVYRLESAAQLFERCRQMLEDRCQSIAVVDAFPAALEALLPSILLAIGRGVTVYVEAYEPIDIPGARLVVAAAGKQVLRQWRTQQVNLIVDGQECVTALLDVNLEVVFQGLWTNSVYLSCLMHSGRLAEHSLLRLERAVECGSPDLLAILREHPYLLQTNVPGHRELLARYAGDHTSQT